MDDSLPGWPPLARPLPPPPPAPEPRALVRGSLTVHLADVPEVLAAVRLEMARLLREAGQDESPEVAAFADRVAAEFEAGVADGEL